MARLHGRKGEISIAASVTPDGSPSDLDFTIVGSLNAWDLSFTRPVIEKTTLRSTAKSFLPGMQDISGTFSGVFDTDVIQTLVSASEDADAVWIRITPSTDYPELFFQGSAWLNLSVAGSVNGQASVSSSFVGNGAWQKSFAA